MISLTLPELATGSQVICAIGNIVEPIKRERMTKAEIKSQLNVSKILNK